MDIEAVPAYNLVHKRENGQPFHPKGVGNGYILTFTDRRVYIAGDTENIPEMKSLPGIDIAFLPMNLPYTMTPEMAADAARMFMPKILYPYHFGQTDTAALGKLLAGTAIEVRVRRIGALHRRTVATCERRVEVMEQLLVRVHGDINRVP